MCCLEGKKSDQCDKVHSKTGFHNRGTFPLYFKGFHLCIDRAYFQKGGPLIDQGLGS